MMTDEEIQALIDHKPATRTGTVKWFNDLKGFGFIIPDATEAGVAQSPDIIVHYSVISVPGHRTLVQGQRVEFKAEKGPRGVACTWVKPL